MDFHTRAKLTVVLLAITFGFTWIFMSWQSQAIQSAIERSSEDFRRDPEEIRASARISATAWREALTALKARRNREAWEAASRAGSFQYEMFGSENLPYEGSQTFRQWFTAREKEFADAVVREYERIAERAVAAPAQSADFTSFYLRFLPCDKRVGKVYENCKGAVLAARLKAARAWVRVAVISKAEAGNIPLAARVYGRDEAEFAFTSPIEEAFRAAWKPTGALSYVTGALLDAREEDAAWLTLVADVRIATALYESKWRGSATPISVEVPLPCRFPFG